MLCSCSFRLPARGATQEEPGGSGNTNIWLVEESLRDPECLGRQTQQSSPTLSLSHDKAEVEPRSVGLPGNVTFARPRSPIDPETANTPFSASQPYQSEVAKCRQCNAIPGKGPWQGSAPPSTHWCPLLITVFVKSPQLPRTQVLIMPDCSPLPWAATE